MSMNEHGFDVNVSFRLNNIMELNGRSLEAPDLAEGELGATVKSVDTDIRRHFDEVDAFDQEFRPTSARSLRPVVLVARLALAEQKFLVLTPQAIHSKHHSFTHDSVLTSETLHYWTELKQAGFQPHVQTLGGVKSEDYGIWIGVSDTASTTLPPTR